MTRGLLRWRDIVVLSVVATDAAAVVVVVAMVTCVAPVVRVRAWRHGDLLLLYLLLDENRGPSLLQ